MAVFSVLDILLHGKVEEVLAGDEFVIGKLNCKGCSSKQGS